MALANLDALKSRGKCWLVRTAATTLLVALLVVSMAGWLYFLGRIGRALFDWISPACAVKLSVRRTGVRPKTNL